VLSLWYHGLRGNFCNSNWIHYRYDERCPMLPEIHPNALKHLNREEVIEAWGSVTKCIMRESPEEPPRWLMVGWLPDGRDVELVAVETVSGWLVIHANTPVQKKFAKEIETVERRLR